MVWSSERREKGYIGHRMLDMELPGWRARGRPRRKFMDAVKEDMKVARVRGEDKLVRSKWRKATSCENRGQRKRKKRKRKKEREDNYMRRISTVATQ